MLIDPHTAVGIGVSEKISLEGNTIILATAHPSKFSEYSKTLYFSLEFLELINLLHKTI